MNDRELINGLDVCRPSGDDLREPALQAIADRVAIDARAQEIHVRLLRIDGAVGRTMHAVSSPEGFESRLIGRLRGATAEAAVGNASDTDVSLSPTPALLASARWLSRRHWLAWAGGLTTVAAAAVVAVLFFDRSQPLIREQLEASGWQWHEQLTEAGKWQNLNRNDIAAHSLPSELRQMPVLFRDASSIVGRDAYAYDVSLAGGPPATLFVIDQEADAGAPAAAPRQPQSSTQGYNIAYWQRGDALYVLVIQSDRPEDYRMLLRTSSAFAA